MDATGWRSAVFQRRSQRRDRQSRIDLPRHRVADHAARPGIQDHRQEDEGQARAKWSKKQGVVGLFPYRGVVRVSVEVSPARQLTIELFYPVNLVFSL